jgi:hypothetical protein
MRHSKNERNPAIRSHKHAKLQANFVELHRKGVYLKRILRQRGIDLPFYDYYDSYVEEFKKTAALAMQQFGSLLGIVEVEDGDYFGTDRSKFAPGMRRIFWNSDDEPTGYGTSGGDKSNINGFTNAFENEEGQVKTLVVIRRAIPNCQPHREFKYGLKLIALLHELGHVYDMERQINFNHDMRKFDLIEAEVFAHLYSLRRMAERNYYHGFNMLVESLQKAVTGTDYLGEVAKLTLERMPKYKLVNINDIELGHFTPAELLALGPDGRQVLGV